MGGRPSAPINPDPGPCDPWKSYIDKEHHTLDHLTSESHRAWEELTRWENFCTSRQKPRRSPEAFNKYKERVHRLEQNMALEWSVQLQLQLEEQTNLDEWKEYYIYEYSKKDRLERRLKRAQREMEAAQKNMKTAESNGSTGTILDAVFSMRAAEVREHEKKISETRKEVESAQKGLESVHMDGPRETVERAQEEFEVAQKRLETLRSDELEQLIKQYYEREGIRSRLLNCQRKLGMAERELKHLNALLKWIEGKFPEEMDRVRPDRAGASNSKRSSSGIAPKASQLKVSGNSPRRKGKHAPAQSVLGQVQPSKISKVSQRKGDHLSREPSAARRRILSSVRLTDNGEPIEQQPTSKTPLRRRQRTSERAPESISSSTSPTYSRELLSLRPPQRRSVRLSERGEKLRALASDAKIHSNHLNKTAVQRSTWRTTTHTNAAYSGKPQRISKTRGGRATTKRKRA